MHVAEVSAGGRFGERTGHAEGPGSVTGACPKRGSHSTDESGRPRPTTYSRFEDADDPRQRMIARLAATAVPLRRSAGLTVKAIPLHAQSRDEFLRRLRVPRALILPQANCGPTGTYGSNACITC